MSKTILEKHDGKLIIVAPENVDTIIPLFCPNCEFPMKTMEDSISYRENKVCHHCNVEFDGKTPTEEEWENYIDKRKQLSKTIIDFA